jgi:hypothetical protein
LLPDFAQVYSIQYGKKDFRINLANFQQIFKQILANFPNLEILANFGFLFLLNLAKLPKFLTKLKLKKGKTKTQAKTD